MNRSRRGLFSAAARSTLGPGLGQVPGSSRRDINSAHASSSQRQLYSSRGQKKVGGRTVGQKQKRIGNSMTTSARMLFNDSMDDSLYMSLAGANSGKSSSNLRVATEPHRYSLPSGSKFQRAPAVGVSYPAVGASGSMYNLIDDDDSLFMSASGNFNSSSFSDSGEKSLVVKDFDSAAVANMVRQFVRIENETAPQAIKIARKIRDLTDYPLMSDQFLDRSQTSSSSLCSNQPASNPSILSTRPW